ncbi:uncharacterized protein LOC120328244 [Styela clava]
MKIPIRHILLMFIGAFLLIKGEKCWKPMVCDGKPTWRDVNTKGQCTEEAEKALEDLTKQVNQMESALYQLEKTINIKGTTIPQANENCGVVYNSKCFRAIVYVMKNVTSSDAESLCENKLANIEDVTHYNLLRDYLRPMIPDGETFLWVHTGMTYKNGQLYSTTGQAMSLPTEVWFPVTPYVDASFTTVVVRVSRNPESIYQGIFNERPSIEVNGVICENE